MEQFEENHWLTMKDGPCSVAGTTFASRGQLDYFQTREPYSACLWCFRTTVIFDARPPSKAGKICA